jgi:hypothetical protein
MISVSSFLGFPRESESEGKSLPQKKGKTEVFPFSGMDMDLFEFGFNNVVDNSRYLSRHFV